jgi:hypothetical protein
MGYTRVWNAAYEATPAGSDPVGQGDDRIRDLKVDIRERMQRDHYFDPAGVDADHGEHVRVMLRQTPQDPPKETAKGCVYTKEVNGITELFYKDSSGHVIQITTGGSLNAAVVFSGELGEAAKNWLINRANHTGTQPPSTISPQGEGSGLNADLVRGNIPLGLIASQAGYNGYIRLSNGLIIQWVKKDSPGPSEEIALPIAFPNHFYSLILSEWDVRSHLYDSPGARPSDNYPLSRIQYTRDPNQATPTCIYFLCIGD